MAELTRPDVDPPSGPAPEDLVVEDIVIGDGPEATPGSLVSAHYVGVTHDVGVLTVTCTGADVLPTYWESPLYVAVMV